MIFALICDINLQFWHLPLFVNIRDVYYQKMKSFESCYGLFLLCLIICLHQSCGFVVGTNNQLSGAVYRNEMSRFLSPASVGVTSKVQQYSTSFVVPSSSSKSFRLFADVARGRGPPPRKAPKDDVVQVRATTFAGQRHAMP